MKNIISTTKLIRQGPPECHNLYFTERHIFRSTRQVMLVNKLICWSIDKKARNFNKIGAINGYYFNSQPTKLAARKFIILTNRNVSRRISYTNQSLFAKKRIYLTETIGKWERNHITTISPITVPSSAHAWATIDFSRFAVLVLSSTLFPIAKRAIDCNIGCFYPRDVSGVVNAWGA